MCGIIGFNGNLDAKEVLVQGLRTLEYRGYDSAGISFFDNGTIKTIKTVGKVSALEEKVKSSDSISGTCGIGHTRWATHGSVLEVNSHPHTCGRITLIHNGIIENYGEIEKKLSKMGMFPVSQTDSEIVAMLIESLYEGEPLKALREVVDMLEGSYAFCILFADQIDTIYCLRNGSPLVAAHCEEGSFVASDVVALVKHSKEYFIVPEHHIAILDKEGIRVTDLLGEEKIIQIEQMNWDIGDARKDGYPHFMIKEIYEQPKTIHNTIAPRIKEKEVCDLSVDHIPDDLFYGINRIIIAACGTAMHAGLIGRVVLEKFLRIPVTVEIASEFRYQEPIMDKHTLVITISQSGETADTLAALRLARNQRVKTLSIVNVKGSSIARESDWVIYTHAGPEVAVASTKAYTAQVSCLYLLAIQFGKSYGKITDEMYKNYIKELQEIKETVKIALTLDTQIKEICKDLISSENLFFIGRGIDYALACEGSIKLKEITYIHSEAYAAGELKHGTLSLVTEGVPVVALATQSKVYGKMVSNIREVTARGAKVILITNGIKDVEDSLCDYHIELPKTSDDFSPFTVAIALQLLAYHTSVHRGIDVDKPRNLAKSVTVE